MMKRLAKEVEDKLAEIAEVLLHYHYDQLKEIGLLGGLSGIMLFLFHYGRWTEKEQYAEKAASLLYQSIDLINEGNSDYSFSQGISGLGWGLAYLAKEEFIDPVDVLHPLDESLCQFMTLSSQEGYWDALHGAIGTASYLFHRLDNPAVFSSIEQLVETLAQQALPDQDGLKWISINRFKKDESYNFGLAHGIPSIIVFLSRCIDQKIKPTLATTLLKKATSYLFSNQLLPAQSINRYPMCIQQGEPLRSERLAWCYGDPGILISLLHANNSLTKGLDYEIAALAQSIIARRNLQENKIHDACLCHGAAGMIPLLLAMQKHHLLSEKIPASIIEYWVRQTLELGNAKEGLAGYQQFSIIEHQEQWSNSIGLLDGISGIGLCLLSYLTKEINWSACLMIR